MNEIEQTQARLENIQSADPLLVALRTISTGGWSKARRQLDSLKSYTQHIKVVLSKLAVKLPPITAAQLTDIQTENISQKRVLLVIGSERGLCGGFNRALFQATADYLQTYYQESEALEIWALGSRNVNYLQREVWPLIWSASLSITTIPPFELVNELAHTWLDRFQIRQLERVDVLYNQPWAGGDYRPIVAQLIPYTQADILPDGEYGTWPPPITETDPDRLFVHILEQFIHIKLYSCLLESAAAEHSARYQLLENATQNVSRLTDELQQSLNMARRQEITAEMQALAVGIGLVR